MTSLKKTIKRLKIGIATDLLELRKRYVNGNAHIRSASISPSGKRVVFDYRGEIITVPEKNGNPRNLTLSPGSHEKDPAWSTDGEKVAYFSDASGEYELHIKSQDGKGTPSTYKLNGSGFYAHVHWSPDSKKISFVDNGRNLYILDIASGDIKKVAHDEYYVPGAYRNLFGDWSPDSNWITYSKIIDTNFEQIYLYSIKDAKSYPVSDGYSNATEPIFDPEGKYLYFFASTDAGPVVNWFDQSNQDMSITNSIYLVTLQKETVSPLAKESDEQEMKEEDQKEKEDEENKKDEKNKKSQKPKPTKIDLDAIQNRIIALPVAAGHYRNLGAAEAGKVLFVEFDPENRSELSKLKQYDFKERKEDELMDLDSYMISADGKKIAYQQKEVWGVTKLEEKLKIKEGVLATEAIEVRIDPIKEWNNIFNEAWRINRDYFYDPGCMVRIGVV